MYGFTMRSYNAGVSRTMWICWLEYCAIKRGVVKDFVIMEQAEMNDLANVHISGWINDINLDVRPVL